MLKLKEKLHEAAAAVRRSLGELGARVRSLKARVRKGAARAA
jgi:hypothetical protein